MAKSAQETIDDMPGSEGVRDIHMKAAKASYGTAKFARIKFNDSELVARAELSLALGGMLDANLFKGLSAVAKTSRASNRFFGDAKSSAALRLAAEVMAVSP